MTSPTLQSRLSKLSRTSQDTLQLITRLSRLQSAPSAQPSPPIADQRLELSQEIHLSLKQQSDSIELLQQEIEYFNPGSRDTEREREKAQLQAQGARLSEDLKLARAQFRKAQLAAKKGEEAVRVSQREQLLAGASGRGAERKIGGRGKLTQEELAVNASSDITIALRRTHQLMQSELGRSQFAHETLCEFASTQIDRSRLNGFLVQSQKALTELGEHHGGITDLLSNSRTLVSSLIRSQKSDSWYLQTALSVLVVTFIWLFIRRFLWIGVTVAIIFPLKTLFWISSLLASRSSANSDSTTSLVEMASGTTGRPTVTAQPVQSPGQHVDKQQSELEDESNKTAGSTLSEEVGAMAEKNQQEAQGAADNKANPKKRMFEADKEAEKDAERHKDEL
ncbi:MAG: hypothetical protein M1814_000650 [Vezdaea aestivalis]|nr:MAG: hypothetical protein M1814_000650 [Vezdaea aestivalis]